MPEPSFRPSASNSSISERLSATGSVRRRRTGHEWLDTALQVFVANDDLDVRRCILPGLSLRVERYPEELRPMVEEAVRIARTSDDYLRHRVEHQV
ncbi:hypothetical protein [Plantactinospora endophytica]|uniref:HEAT repeat domain-containing protein n=1 Tax=Plantactinospora endophytica TaxID=673535 RepID=A0ABQ4DY45_9ACTN|nr:hypothetical protein [Plantactinospora endophytica]GIG87369.1 hypothetical protein Pen02_23050 [Plantactinospora endophytica]